MTEKKDFSKGNVLNTVVYFFGQTVTNNENVLPQSNIVTNLNLTPTQVRNTIRKLERFYEIKIEMPKFYPATVEGYADLVIKNKDNYKKYDDNPVAEFIVDLLEKRLFHAPIVPPEQSK